MPRRLPARSLLIDVCVGLGLTAFFVASTSLATGFHWGWPLMRDVLEGISVGMRRVWTIPALITMLTVTAFNDINTWPYPLGLAILIYTAAAENYPRRWVWAATILGAVLLIWPWVTPARSINEIMVRGVPEAFLFTVVPALFGFYSQARVRLLEALSARAADADRRRLLEAEKARAEERNRLANEIHDIVAHRVSLMVVHSGALKLAAPDERTREVADLVRQSGRQALEELRELVGVLRTGESAPLGPAPRLDNLPTLLEEARTAGGEIDLEIVGEPRRTATTVERTAYRVVQEALTNVRKHAPGAKAEVRLVWRSKRLELTVHNGRPASPPQSFPDSGYGLASLRERVALVSGTFVAGPSADGGWTVNASLPLGGEEK